MIFNRIYQRLEIKFWLVAVAAMQDKKILGMLTSVFFIAAIILLVMIVPSFKPRSVQAGILPSLDVLSAGQNDGLVGQDSKPKQSGKDNLGYEDMTTSAHKKQINTLVILADDLSTSDPLVEGLWLVVSLPHNSQLSVVPVFPIDWHNGAPKKVLLAEIIDMHAQYLLEKNIQSIYDTQNAWWDHYLILDKYSLAVWIQLSGMAKDMESIAYLVSPQTDLQAQFKRQETIARGLCWGIKPALKNVDPTTILVDLHGRLFTDNNLSGALNDFSSWNEQGAAYRCEFPAPVGQFSMLTPAP